MANKYDQPPAYSNPEPPQPTYHQGGDYNQQPQQWQQQGPPPQAGYYQPGPQMGYYPQQQGPYQQGPYQQYPPQGGYYPPQGGYYDDRRSGPGCLEAMLAGLACCCCLDCLLF